RAADLIGHFKQVAVDQTSARRRRFDLRQTVEELLITLKPQFRRTAHRIELDIAPGLELDSYPGPLEQVIANLVSNSLIHGFAGGEVGCIRIEAAPLDADPIRLCYSDDGAGIPDAIRHRIFDPFFTTRLGSGGSGLGLYIVYNLVTGMLGGTIQVHGTPKAGTTFILTLPRCAPDHPSLKTLVRSTHRTG
ncbi:MAG: HAMP domain-containing sensor histidine kinase, partial [Candidatus Competibacter sp.]|nr:HAMP domain-containing sensor histidine kinase [Candidatus Competibacter sp.]